MSAKTLRDFIAENAAEYEHLRAVGLGDYEARETVWPMAATGFLDAVGLTARPVIDAEDVEWLRVIRNTCRLGFAHDHAPIAQAAQEQWWQANQGSVVAYLYQDAATFVVGYALLRLTEDGRWWSSVAVLPPYSGRGYGGAMTAHIIRQSPTGVTHGQALVANPAAARLHHARDWDVLDNDGVLWTFRTKAVLP